MYRGKWYSAGKNSILTVTPCSDGTDNSTALLIDFDNSAKLEAEPGVDTATELAVRTVHFFVLIYLTTQSS